MDDKEFLILLFDRFINREKYFRISERRAAERREQYKLVREHVKKEDGRIEAYGWSLPNVEAEVSSVPIPVCCRPLLDNEPSLKIWCATGVVLRGGRDERGQWIVGDPIYFAPASMKKTKTSNHRPELEDEIKVSLVDYLKIYILQ